MLSILGYDGTTIALLEPANMAGWLNQAGAKIWLDVQAPSVEEMAWLQAVFSLPRLMGEGWPVAAAALHPTPRWITGHLPLYPATHLDFYLGQSVLLTTHPDPLPHLSQLWLTYQQDMSRWPYGLDYLLYQLLQQLTIIPPTTRQTIQASLSISTDDRPGALLLELTHQLHTQKHHQQQAQLLIAQLTQQPHDLMDANTRHHCQQLHQQITAQIEEINLWQNWLAVHQQQYQIYQNRQTQKQLRYLLWVVILSFLIGLLTLLLFAIYT